jgi:hypothetical protein
VSKPYEDAETIQYDEACISLGRLLWLLAKLKVRGALDRYSYHSVVDYIKRNKKMWWKDE